MRLASKSPSVFFFLLCLASESRSGSRFSLVSGWHGRVFGCSASCVWLVSRGLAVHSRYIWSSRAVFSLWCVMCLASESCLALNSRLYLVSSGRVLAAVHYVSGE